MTKALGQSPVRFGRARIDGRVRVLVQWHDDAVYPLSAWPSALSLGNTVEAIAARWQDFRPTLMQQPTAHSALAADDIDWLPPVSPGKVICVGTNYRDHVAEMSNSGGPSGRAEPFPFGFLKPPTTSLTGNRTVVALPSVGERLDWEVELAMIIGDPAQLGNDDPLDAVFGYTVMIDLSIRDFVPFPHALGMDAVVAKGFDDSAPLGPWITPSEWVADPQDLALTLAVNGQSQQAGNTSDMIFDLREILTHFSRVLSLEPGDVISTGTPAGVGMGKQPPRYLTSGDRVEARVAGLGELRIEIGKRHAVHQRNRV